MASSSVSFNRTVKNERGYQALKKDRGNYVCSDPGYWAEGKSGVGPFTCKNGKPAILVGTNWGISAPVLSEFLGRMATVQDMKSLTKETALLIYQKNYWSPLALDGITDQALADLAFDGAINEGMPFMKGVMADSVSLPHSSSASSIVAKINKTPSAFDKIKEARAAHYKALGGSFYNSWMDRLSGFEDYAKKNPAIVITVALLFFLALGFIAYKWSKAR